MSASHGVRLRPQRGQRLADVFITRVCRWLSTVYMSMVQLGVQRPRPDALPGWAWAGQPDPPSATRLADFVAAALRGEAERSGAGPPPPSQVRDSDFRQVPRRAGGTMPRVLTATGDRLLAGTR